ncbi:hypothetical protein P0W64_08370 [Tsukamurella sp. 8F]|uniref:hypothetical protein n=1 Tax=unclassified Tsukamurella TaxID=2633480 RepID=UPI0023B9D26B|nr:MULTISPECIES: hypothetical protein [unclassified Tsukamurella]MDF0530567.1 hypothetical protein [Tsukamurella sp. 8J]MDF0586783.1 hypothetical protein [Tsukamurella sp. 8F]
MRQRPSSAIPAVVHVDARLVLDGARIAVEWAASRPGASAEFAHARVFLIAQDGRRTYLGVADGSPARFAVPASLPAGEYRVELDAYSSGSWGGGHLSGRGLSEPIGVGRTAGGER